MPSLDPPRKLRDLCAGPNLALLHSSQFPLLRRYYVLSADRKVSSQQGLTPAGRFSPDLKREDGGSRETATSSLGGCYNLRQ